jgi:cephalosporin-C deacetylase-like acetyl esterase
MTSLLLLLAFAQPPEDLRAKMLALIGGLPEVRTPLNARVTGVLERPGYRVEKLLFDSLPGFHVTANLYVPTDRSGPFPAVLGTAGHSPLGKAAAVYQRAWISLVRRGYVVLAYDPPGQGERIEYFDPEMLRPRLRPGGVEEHIMAGLQCLLVGHSIARYFVWDGIRAFDYLTTRPEVDPGRIGVAGNSGGGTQAAYLAVFEPRLAAAVSSCYITRWKELWDGPGPQDAEQVWPGFLAAQLDFADFIRVFAPKPFLISSAIRDFFPIEGARATFRAAAEFYREMDAPGRLEMAEHDDTHGWSKPLREATVRFFDRHLRGVEEPYREPELDTEPESRLWVTPTGYLANSIGSETVFTLNRAAAADIYPRRRALSIRRPDELQALVSARLKITLPPQPALGRSGGAPGIVTAGVPKADLDDLRQSGWAVRPADLGALPEGRIGYSAAYQAAAREWLYGRSLLGRHVEAVLRAAAELKSDPAVDPKRIFVYGRGAGGVAVLIAAALDEQLAGVVAEQSITSWYAVTQAKLHEGTAEIVVPGVLKDFDLPDLVNLIAPRPIWLADPRTPGGGRADASEYPRVWVRLVERGEDWPAGRWLAPLLATPQ